MGILFYFPFIVWAVFAIVLMFNDFEEARFFQGLQYIFLPMYCFWPVFRYSELLEDGAWETLINLYKKHAIIDLMRYYTVMNLLMILLLFFLNLADVPWHLILFALLLGLNFLLIGALLILLVKNVEMAFGFIAIYTVVEYVTNGELIPWPHFFYKFNSMVDGNEAFVYAANILSIVIASLLIRRKLTE